MILYNGCLFIHIPKTGGTSMRTAIVSTANAMKLARVRKPEDGIRKDVNNYKPHSFLREAIAPFGDLYDDLWKFTCVRNPWDRYVSLYTDINGVDPFPKWLDFILNQKYDQSQYFVNDFDFVARLETMTEDWKVISKCLGIKRKLPHLNSSRRTDKHYSERYTPEMVEKVAKNERVLLDRFDYKFEVPQTAQPVGFAPSRG